MKILHVVPSYFPATRYGGPIYSVHGLCKALAGLGHEVHVYTTNVDGERDSDVALGEAVDLDGVKVWYFPSRRLRRLYYSLPMKKALERTVGDFDIVHLHSVFLWPTWAGARAAHGSGVPYVLSPRGMLVRDLVRRKSRWLKTAWIQLIERGNIGRASAVHVTSRREAEDLVEFGFDLPQVWTIANGIDEPLDWEADEVSEDVGRVVARDGYVLFFGRINWKKGLDRLIRAWGDIAGARLVIAGNDEEGYLPELQKIAHDTGVEDRVVFLARSITGPDKEALFARASLFVLPSYSENFGNTVLEGMIRSVPVVVTEEVGAAEVVRESGGGKVVSADSLAEAVTGLLRDPEGLMDMGKQGAEWVAGRYSWAQIANDMVAKYKEVVCA